MPAFRFPFNNSTLLGALLGNESGGRNVVQGNIGDVNNRTGDLAKGYFQITGSTWRDFGGLKYASSPLAATYAQQADIASKIPLGRWGPNTITAMRATGKPIDPRRTLGENLAAQGENFGATATITPAGQPPASDAPPPVSDQLTGVDKAKPLSGLLGELAQGGGGGQMQPMQLIQPSAGQDGGQALADIVQKYLAAQRRGQQPQQQGQ